MSLQYKTKTEHAGPKQGRGAWWGLRQEAKEVSRKLRRRRDRTTIEEYRKEGNG